MGNVQSLSHSKCEYIYYITWIPKYRKKKIYKELRTYLAMIFGELARQKECKVMEGHLMSDHVHVMMSIPPKYTVAQIIGFIKCKSAIQIARNFVGRKKKKGRYTACVKMIDVFGCLPLPYGNLCGRK